MKILHVWTIDYGPTYPCMPEIVVELNGDSPSCHHDGLRFEERNGLYRAEREDGICHYMSWQGPHNEGGFGGWEPEITMLDGTRRTLRGPWSSNAGAINHEFPDRDPIVNCVTTKSITIDILKRVLEDKGVTFELDRYGYWRATNPPINMQEFRHLRRNTLPRRLSIKP